VGIFYVGFAEKHPSIRILFYIFAGKIACTVTVICKNDILLDVFSMMHLKRLIIFIAAVNSFFCAASGNIPDSLENALKRVTSDTAKVMVYNNFARKLVSGQGHDYSRALLYARQGLTLAGQVQFPRGEAELHRTMGIACFYMNSYDQAIEHYLKASDLCEKMQDNNGLAQNYYNISLVYRKQSQIYYSLDNLLKALSIWKQSGNTDGALTVYKDIIQLYQNVDEYRVAADYTMQALALAQETGNRQEEASLYDMLARINTSMGNVWAVEEYYDHSLKLYEELGDQLQIARITQNIAANLYPNNTEKALELLEKSAAIYEKTSPANSSLYTVYNNIANLHQAEGRDDSTGYYKEKALSKAILSGNPQTMAYAYYTTGRFYMNKGALDRAEKDFRKSYSIAVKNRLANMQSDALSGLSSVNYRQADYRTAMAYLRKYQAIKDSLTVEENKRNILQLTMQYEFEKAGKEKNEAIKTQLAQQQQTIRQQQAIVVITSLALIFTALLLVFIFRSNKLNRQANTKLENQRRKILRINSDLQESHHELYKYKTSLEEMVKEQTARLQQSELQLRTLSDNLPGGCIYRKHVYHGGRELVSYISSTAEEWLGLSAETIISDIGRLYRQIVPEDLEQKRMLEKECTRTMSSYSCEYRLTKGDREVWLLENTMPHADKNQDIVWDGIIVDITDRKKFEKELIKAKERAEESDMLKSSFLANMSTEILTPMNGIVEFLGVIEREDLSTEKRRACTRIIRSNVQQLLKLIEDVIDISKIDSSQLSLHRIRFDPDTLLDELEIFFQDFILKRDKKLELILDRSQSVSPGAVESDPVRVRQILSNLIGNAIKFTDKGYIRFGYRLTDDCSSLYFFVEDTGIGIPEAKQKYIFERFRQACDEKTRATYGGTGLGLAISKSLVEMMGGQIGVRSEAGGGSTFYFTLPFSPAGKAPVKNFEF
jgi:PAS domain S-box-containing protein